MTLRKFTVYVEESTFSGILLSSALLDRNQSELIRNALGDHFKVTVDNVCQVVRLPAPTLCAKCHQPILVEDELALDQGPNNVVHIRCGDPLNKA